MIQISENLKVAILIRWNNKTGFCWNWQHRGYASCYIIFQYRQWCMISKPPWPNGTIPTSAIKNTTGHRKARYSWLMTCHGAPKWIILPMENTELNSYNIIELYIIEDTYRTCRWSARHCNTDSKRKANPLTNSETQSQQKHKQMRENKETTKNGK